MLAFKFFYEKVMPRKLSSLLLFLTLSLEKQTNRQRQVCDLFGDRTEKESRSPRKPTVTDLNPVTTRSDRRLGEWTGNHSQVESLRPLPLVSYDRHVLHKKFNCFGGGQITTILPS